ncbi:MAG: hypothetical protein IPM37_20500 [Hahellaceae bacterium]|nr:hypothetical protein [Hahellaceae bacterium]
MIIDKYLESYSENERWPAAVPEGCWSVALVIPVCDEIFDDVCRVTEAIHTDAVLEVWVLNHPEGASTSVQQANQVLVSTLALRAGQGARLSDAATLFRLNGRSILLLNCPNLPVREGVGLARKIGADRVVQWWRLGIIRSPWIFMTDADARLPADYFQRVNDAASGVSACVYPFEHMPEGGPLQQQALRAYEKRIRDYEQGLRLAGSPYAFVAIGSLIACPVLTYVRVRGMPRRAAGEDFYLLNKAAKLGLVHPLGGAPVKLSGRVSRRVPFGTGQVLAEALETQGRTPRLLGYPRALFDSLGVLLSSVQAASAEPGASAEQGLKLCRANLVASGLPEAWVDESLGFFRVEQAMGQWQKTALSARRTAQFHEQFDALKTLQWVHWWRAKGDTLEHT